MSSTNGVDGSGGGQGSSGGAISSLNQGHSQAVTCATSVTMNGEFYALTGSLDTTVKAWDGNANLQITEGHGQGVYALETVVDTGGNTLLIVGLEKGNIMVRHFPSFTNLFSLDTRYTFGHAQGPVRTITKGPSQTFFTGAEDGRAFVWQIAGDVAAMVSKQG